MGKRNNKETEYLYASARVRATESRLIGADKLEAAISSKGLAETEALISSLDIGEGKTESADKLGDALSSAYSFIGAISPDDSVAAFLRYAYDCNNIKAALKCFFRGIDPGEMLFSFGTVSKDEIKEMPVKGDFSALPKNMSEAASEAFDAYSETKNPQLIDIILDKACFRDMLSAAEESGEDFIVSLTRKKIDLVNIMMCVRTARMGGGFAEREVLHSSLISGGELDVETLFASESEEDIALILRGGEYDGVSELMLSGRDVTLAELECACDNIYMTAVKRTKYIPFGASVLCSYLIAVEYEIKNLRIIHAGKLAGLSPDKIRERVRLSYV
ncbi:MAG: hypothetical protein E7671_01650 [Ruminococcaceae bacterium]|nr:hypothetical protein [Oscillospiraceae bacterium]